MKIHQAFTLIEIAIAIVITGVVALLAYGSVQAGFDSGDRIERHRTEVESAALLRSVVVDALRHPAAASGSVASSFSVTQGGEAGLNDDRLQFVSRGVSPPHGAGALWNVVLEPTATGLRFSAHPLEPTSELPLVSMLPGIRGMRVRVIASDSDPVWRTGWESRNLVPRAIELRFFDVRNQEVGAPTVVVTSMEMLDDGA